MLSKKTIAPSLTAFFSASILKTICELDVNSVTKPIHHRVRELHKKLQILSKSKPKNTNTKKYLEASIEKLMDVRKMAKEIEVLSSKIAKLHDSLIMPDIKNAIHLAKAAGKSALNRIKVNKTELKKVK